MLLYNATIKVGDEEYEYLLIRGNRIEKIGRGNLPRASKKINLHGATVLPGFCDSHTHLSNVALQHSQLDLTGKDRNEILDIVAKECRKRKYILGRGWDESFWEKKEYISKEELDAVCREKIVFLIREDGHLAVMNSAAENKFNISTEDGIVREKDVERIMKKLKISESLDFDFAQEYALSKGITCIHDFASINTLRRYMDMHRKGKLKIRIYANFYKSSYSLLRKMGIYSGYGDSFLRIGSLKLFADGSIGAKTAATRYADGVEVKPLLSGRKLRAIVRNANSSGIAVMTHAIGDIAIEEVLRAYRETKGNRIEHFELALEEHIDALDGTSVSMQPNFLKWAKKGGLYERMLGTEWLERNNPYRRILDEGKTLLFGSDCMPMDPLFGIDLAINSEYRQQRIGLDEAIRAYTLGAKYFGSNYGELREGYMADLVVIKGDIWNTRNTESLKIWMTIVDGRIMYTSG